MTCLAVVLVISEAAILQDHAQQEGRPIQGTWEAAAPGREGDRRYLGLRKRVETIAGDNAAGRPSPPRPHPSRVNRYR
jgi:hypothetical protein